MINFGNLSPLGASVGLIMYYANSRGGAPAVSIAKVSGTEQNAVWVGDGIAAGLDLLHTGPNNHDTLYLTMSEDKAGAAISMQRWAGHQNNYNPLQVWTSINLPNHRWFFRSQKGHLLQASGLTEGSSLIVGAYPEINDPDPTPKTPGQIWISTIHT
jgi:hypothetical protein